MTREDGLRHRIRMMIPLWGQRYYEQWLELAGPSLLAPGNVPYLHEHADFEMVFLCKSQDLDFFKDKKIMQYFSNEGRIKQITIDEFFPEQTPISYGVPLTLAFAKGIRDLGEDGLGTFVMEMNADFVLSEGTLAQVLRRLDEGYQIVSAPSLRVNEDEARRALIIRLRECGIEKCFSARPLMKIAERYLHNTVRSRIINSNEPVEAWYYHIVYWRLSQNCLAGRSFLVQPLCFQIRRYPETVTCPHDYGFLREFCPGGRFTVIGDSDQLLMIELQQRHSESDLLEPRPDFTSSNEAMEYRIQKIIANAGEWATAEHHRGFGHPLLFHSDDLPADSADQLAEFDRQIARIATDLPPPVPTSRHPHWLGALKVYRAALSADGTWPYPALLDDDANRIFRTLLELPSDIATQIPPLWEAEDVDWTMPEPITAALTSASNIITLTGLIREVLTAASGARLFPMEVVELHNQAVTVNFPLGIAESMSSLVIYLLLDSLPYWANLRDLCRVVIDAGGIVQVIFRDRSWRNFDPQQPANSWMMSLLSEYFPSEEYCAQISPIVSRSDAGMPQRPWGQVGKDILLPIVSQPWCCGFLISLKNASTVT